LTTLQEEFSMISRRPISGLLGPVVIVALLATPAGAAEMTADALVQTLDPTITEVTTTGNWEAGGRKGVYRAIVVMSGVPDHRIAEAFVQWIAPKADGSGFEVVASKPVQAFNERRVDNAELTMDSEKISEGTLLVQSYDPAKDTDQGVTVKLGNPGELTIDEQAPSE
jgi:hypothetical protein